MCNTSCDHNTLSFASSTHATEAGYCRPTAQRRTAAISPQGVSLTTKRTKTVDDLTDDSSSFPAPLVLPNDELSLDPRCPPQSMRAWIRSKDRNKVTPAKSTIYVASPPGVDSDVELIRTWNRPSTRYGYNEAICPPETRDIIDYLGAFYDGMAVKLLPFPLSFVAWNTPASRVPRREAQESLRYIGLTTSTECIRIRTRQSADKIFTRQLNLDDLLDAAISMLPEDAYALLMLVDHDLFESEDDAFVCGRAYGGSRVAVISTARYNPVLDSVQNVERQHAWPTSHCKYYLQECCAATSRSPARNRGQRASNNATSNRNTCSTSFLPVVADDCLEQGSSSALQAAVAAHKALPSLDASSSATTLAGLWRGRVCRTASHELGHCFGIEHCVYYACVMQGSSSLSEDARQPPYLCPVDLAKLLTATGSSAKQRYSMLLRFCENHEDTHLFAAFTAWIRVRLKALKAVHVEDHGTPPEQ